MLSLRGELNTLNMWRNESVVRYFNREPALVWELETLRADVGDEQLVTALLVVPQGKYDLVATVLAVQQGLTVEVAQERLQATETRLGINKGTYEGNALVATDGTRPRADKRGGRGDRPKRRDVADVRCFKCNELGLYKRDCTKKNNGGRPSGGGGGGAAGLAMMALVTDDTAALRKWVMDSVGSHHMIGKAGLLTDAKQCAPVRTLLADGGERVATTSGTVHLTITVDGGESSLALLDVLFVPGLTTSLFSVRQESQNGYEIEFRQHTVLVRHSGSVQLQGALHGKPYVLPTVATGGAALTAAAPPTAAMWHSRFSRLKVTLLVRTAGAVNSMHLDKAQVAALRAVDCPPCIGGNMVRAPFHVRDSRTTALLQIVHTNSAGPMEVRSAGGALFTVGVIDAYSHFKALVPVQTKGEVKDVVMTIVNRWEAQTGQRIQVVRSDGGKEYTGKDGPKWICFKDVQHRTTTGFTLQSNGLAERYNRVVVELMQAALLDSGIDRKYWAEAAVNVNYLGNRVVGRQHTITPYELFYGKRPDVEHLRPFGCRAWMHVPTALRGKMSPRAVESTILGYGIYQKGYRILVNGKVETSGDVRFDESDRPVLPTLATPRVPPWPTDANYVHFPLELDAFRPYPQTGRDGATGTSRAPPHIASLSDAVAAARLLTSSAHADSTASYTSDDGGVGGADAGTCESTDNTAGDEYGTAGAPAGPGLLPRTALTGRPEC